MPTRSLVEPLLTAARQVARRHGRVPRRVAVALRDDATAESVLRDLARRLSEIYDRPVDVVRTAAGEPRVVSVDLVQPTA